MGGLHAQGCAAVGGTVLQRQPQMIPSDLYCPKCKWIAPTVDVDPERKPINVMTLQIQETTNDPILTYHLCSLCYNKWLLKNVPHLVDKKDVPYGDNPTNRRSKP